MTELEARRLRKLYYDGTLSAADTRKLAHFVLSDACPEAWRPERGMFAALLSPPALPEGFMQRLQQTVEATAREVAEARTIAAEAQPDGEDTQPGEAVARQESADAPPTVRMSRRRWRRVGALLAAAALCGALWVGLTPGEEQQGVQQQEARIRLKAPAADVPTAGHRTLPAEREPVALACSSVQPAARWRKASSLRRKPRAGQNLPTAAAATTIPADTAWQSPSDALPSTFTASAEPYSIYEATAHTPEEVEAQLQEVAAFLAEVRSDCLAMTRQFQNDSPLLINLPAENDTITSNTLILK